MAHSETIIDGILYPSVTTVLGHTPKPWLDKWRERWGSRAERKTAAANAIGTKFHEGAEALAWGKDYLASGRVYNMLARLEPWLIAVLIKPKATELKVISRKYGYSGTLDGVFELTLGGKRVLVLVDWKTSSGIYPDMALQLVAYAKAYEEMTGTRLKIGLIVLVSKDKPHHKLVVQEYKLTQAVFKRFLKRLADYNAATIGAAA